MVENQNRPDPFRLLRTVPSLSPEVQGLAVPAVAVVWWWLALQTVGPLEFGDLGLVSVLPVSSYVPGLLLLVSFIVLLARDRLNTFVLAAHLGALVLVIHGTLPALYETPRFVWSYKHIGVIHYLVERGRVDQSIDAYHNWPGFFAVFSSLLKASGWSALDRLASWAPLYFNLAYLLPLLVIFRRLSSSPRLPWLALLTFVLSSWTNQDYFAPQALGYLLSFLILALTLSVTPLRTRALGLGPTLRGWLARPAPRLITGLIVGLLLVALASSHQLTPFMLLGFLLSLAVTGTVRYLGWLALAAATVALWLTQMAAPFMLRHSDWLDALGRLGENLQVNLGPELTYSADHTLVLKLTQVAVRLVWGLAVVGALRLLLTRRLNWPLFGLAAAPLPMIALGSYGGEMLLRIYFFSLPFVALLAATALFGERVAPPRRRETAAALLCAVAMFGLLQFSAFGNERTNQVPPEDVRMARDLYRSLPPDSALVVFSVDSFPIKLTASYPDVVHLQLVDNRQEALIELRPENLLAVREQLRTAGLRAGFVVFSPSQRTYMEKFRLLRPGGYDRFEDIVRRDPSAALYAQRGGLRIYRITPAPRVAVP